MKITINMPLDIRLYHKLRPHILKSKNNLLYIIVIIQIAISEATEHG